MTTTSTSISTSNASDADIVTTLEVDRQNLSRTRLRTQASDALPEGAARFGIDCFALTANNITYAAFGEAMDYWRFFPSDAPGWGVVPVWGFATAVASRHPDVAVGERFYGYWPTADHAVLHPGRADAAGLRDTAAHRKALHPVYNQYLRCGGDGFYTPDSEDIQALLRPLFTTAWLIDDFLHRHEAFGARTLLLSSASSKTAWSTAACLAQRSGWEVVGLTSPANLAFTESLGLYHRVLPYGALETGLDAAAPAVYVDFAGNATLRRRVHTHWGDSLRHSASIGGTHVAELGHGRDLPGPKPTLFFAPAQISQRVADWGAAGLNERLVQAWHALRQRATQATPPWLAVRAHHGAQAVQAAYAEVLGGRGDPREGHMLHWR